MAPTRRKKKRTHNLGGSAQVQQVTAEKVPKSFVISRGKLPSPLKQLQFDLRKLMLPNTALKLKDKKNNTLKDFVHVAGPLGVTHFLIISNTEKAPYLRVARCPRGPTLTFQIHDYSLMADIARAQARPRVPEAIFKNSPLIVLAGFSSEEQQLKLSTVMFQNIFPAIDVNTVNLLSCQRVVLMKYDKETKLIDFRHYSITLQPVGVSRRIKKFVQQHQVPDLRDFKDVSEFVTRPNYGSESELEDEAATVKLAKDYGRINKASTQNAVKLHEIGPRMTLKLVKVEEGLCSGDIIFHEYVKKTPEEIKTLRENKEKQEALRKQRRAEQEANVRRKQLAKEALKKQQQKRNVASEAGGGGEENDDSDMDDAEWYRQEVGEEPDAEFLTGVKRKQELKANFPKRKPKNAEGQRLESNDNQGQGKQSFRHKEFRNKRKQRDFEKDASTKDGNKRQKLKESTNKSRRHDHGSLANKILAQKKQGKSKDSRKKRK